MHVMLDLETMGTRHNAPIISIGAVEFDELGTYGEFYVNVDLKSSVVEGGSVICPDTVNWWMGQSGKAMSDATADGMSITGAVKMLRSWMGTEIDGVWGNGALADNLWVSEQCHRLGVPVVWPFWKDRCYRTVKAMFPDVKLVRTGTHHNALDDAMSQANHLIEICKVNNFNLG